MKPAARCRTEQIAENLRATEAFALPLFRAGHGTKSLILRVGRELGLNIIYTRLEDVSHQG